MDRHKEYNLLGNCPFCSEGFGPATCINLPDKKPDKGDMALCIVCGEWAVVDGPRMRKPTDAEYIEIAADQNMGKAREAWTLAKEAQRRAKEEKLNSFPPFENDFQCAMKEFTAGEPAAAELAALRVFFIIGALCVVMRTHCLKGGREDFFMALSNWKGELTDQLNSHLDGLGGDGDERARD